MKCSGRILIVDDELHIRKSFKTLLAAEGYKVESAGNGREAVNLLNKEHYDLVLLDLGLPDMSGHQLTDIISAQNPDIAIIIMTGDDSIDSALEALRKRVYDYFKKPVEYDFLSKTIKKAIEYKQLEIALREREAIFRIFSDAAWEGIVIYDNDVIFHANQQFYNMFACEKKDLRWDVILNRLHFIESQIRINSTESYETVKHKKNGFSFFMEVRIKAMEYNEKVVRVAAIRDISERKKIESDNLTLQKKLGMANKMQALGLMAGSVAHDLNNILSALVSYPELILMKLPKKSPVRKKIKLIMKSGKKAAAIVADLLIVSRGATNRQKILNLKSVVKEYLTSVEYIELKKKYPDISINLQIDSDIMNIKTSPVHVGKALMNLVINAYDAIKGEGNITISAQNIRINTLVTGYENIPEGEYVLFTVSDDGCGISAEEIERIFEPFYSQKVLGRSGTGLGLAIVWNALKDSNGYIDVTSNGKGTIFSLYFPITKDQIIMKEQQNLFEEFTGNGEKILLVDDDESQRIIGCELLDELGYLTKAVSSGEKAIEFLSNNSVDLLMLDMIMDPGISGLETFKKILEHQDQQKAIIVSGFSQNRDIEEALKIGINHHLQKPYTIKTLGQSIKTVLSK